MTIKQAFRTIGRAYEKPPSKRNKLQKKLTHKGICYAVGQLVNKNCLTMKRYDYMLKLVTGDVRSCKYIYYNYFKQKYFMKPITKNDFLRAFYCYLMAEVGE